MREVLLIVHFIGLAMGLGTSFAHLFLGIEGSKMPEVDAGKFRMHTLALSRMGHIGLALLIISGIFLMGPYWNILFSTPLLLTKLIAVVVLVMLISVIQVAAAKAKKGDTAQFKKIAAIGKFSFITALLIVILAVYFFR